MAGGIRSTATLPLLVIRYRAPHGIAMRHWGHEGTAVVRLGDEGTTHLVGREALAVVQAASEAPVGLGVRELARSLGIEDDAEIEAILQGIINGLIQSGLLRRYDDDADPGPDTPR